MKWLIPAKTFLVGEYAAVLGGPAIVLTTMPCFEVSLVDGNHHEGIHPDSPAGQWWASHRIPDKSLVWRDPYEGKGGLGASSAQFLGTYLASCHLLKIKPSHKVLLDAYYQSSWRGEGLRPSAYDLLAQSQHRCVYVNRQEGILQPFDWVFKDIAFLLVHSGQKLMTHYHLKRVSLPDSMHELSLVAESARTAFLHGSSEQLIAAVDAYQTHLTKRSLVAQHSLEHLQTLKLKKHILTAKGCGAMGADVLLLIVERDALANVGQDLVVDGWTVLASSEHIYTGSKLLENNTGKILEILP